MSLIGALLGGTEGAQAPRAHRKVTAVPGQTTHHVEIGPDTVTKTYASWDRGEPAR
jgi:hypothetical protein